MPDNIVPCCRVIDTMALQAYIFYYLSRGNSASRLILLVISRLTFHHFITPDEFLFPITALYENASNFALNSVMFVLPEQ